MKDLFNSYHKQKALSHLWILALSWVLAVSINMFILWGPSWDALKANLKEIQTSNAQNEDIVILSDENSVLVQNTQQMDDVVELNLSFAYDSELLMFWETVSSLEWINISKIETTPGFTNFLIIFDSPVSISENTELVNIWFTKKEEKTVHLNPVNLNFTDALENNYSLTVSSLIF